MPGKKAHKPRNTDNAGLPGVNKRLAKGRKIAAQTPGQSERDPKGRHGQYGGAGDPPLMKK